MACDLPSCTASSRYLRLLLDKGANPRVEDLTKTQPLHLAVKNGHAGAAELLLKGRGYQWISDIRGVIWEVYLDGNLPSLHSLHLKPILQLPQSSDFFKNE